jgi:hypothetical protein
MSPELQTALTISVPTITVLVGILINNSRLTDLKSHMDTRFESVEKLMMARFDTARAELLRVEQVMDARVTHLEEKKP